MTFETSRTLPNVYCILCRYVVGVKFAFQTSRALFIALDLLEGMVLVLRKE